MFLASQRSTTQSEHVAPVSPSSINSGSHPGTVTTAALAIAICGYGKSIKRIFDGVSCFNSSTNSVVDDARSTYCRSFFNHKYWMLKATNPTTKANCSRIDGTVDTSRAKIETSTIDT